MGKKLGPLERDGLIRIEPSPVDGRSPPDRSSQLGKRLPEFVSGRDAVVQFEGVQSAPAARDAFEKRWSTLAPAQRGAYLFKLADLILENLEELGQLEALDTGKSVKNATGEIWFAAETYRYYAGWATKRSGRSFDLSLQADPYHCVSLRQPVGVVGGIIAWNFPFVLASWKVAPALAAGCTMILKPESVPRCSA